ncbi:MAG: esterase family protein [Lentisphaeria bacterium]|nr:esterase family protein [Lentisphaeria bacterium]
MALIKCDFYSETLGISTEFAAILPQNTTTQIGMDGKESSGKPPVLYLLHGMSDDHTIWGRRTSIERYVAALGIAVIMPCGARSFYRNCNPQMRYWDFLSQELPELVKKFFNVSDRREDTYVAGLSMGGYGAFKLAFNQPERFAAAASFSGSFENRWLEECNPTEYHYIFGNREDLTGTEDDLLGKAKALAGSGKEMPRLYMGCGTEDFLYDVNVEYRDKLQAMGYDLTYRERPGVHSWDFWDVEIQTALDWMFKDRK